MYFDKLVRICDGFVISFIDIIDEYNNHYHSILMTQHDFNVDGNQSFPAFETDLNNALVALATTSSGNVAPTTTFANQLWIDTSTTPPLLKVRNPGNTAWVTLGKADVNLGLVPSDIAAAPLASPSLTGTPTAPTPTNTDNTTKIATTAFVNSFVAGSPTTTTQGISDNSTKVASTAFVKNEIDARTRLILTRTSNLTISTFGSWFNPDYSTIHINSGEYVGSATRVFTVATTGYYEINHSACVLFSGGTLPTTIRLGVGWSVNSLDRLIAFSQTDRDFLAQTGHQKLLLTAGNTISPKLYLEVVGGSGYTCQITTNSPPSFSIIRVA
jgi:hypothetical protein